MAIISDPAFDTPKGNAPSTRLTATLTDNSVATVQIDDMPGFPGRPLDRAGMTRKFRSNVGNRWPAAKVDQLAEALWNFDRASDLGVLLGQFVLSS